MKRTIVAAAVLGFAFATPAFAAKSDQRVYGATAGSSMTLKDYEAKGRKDAPGTTRTAATRQANAAQAKSAAQAPSPGKKKPAKKTGVN